MHGAEVQIDPIAVTRVSRIRLAELAAEVEFVWPALAEPLLISWSDGLRLVLDGELPWIFGPAERDPLQGDRGRSVLPNRARARLKAIAASCPPFQRVAIAHELDPRGPVRHLLPTLGPGPQPCPDDVARGLVGEVPAHPRVAGVLKTLDWAVSTPTRAASSSGGAVRRVLDPIVFGVLAPAPPQDGQPTLWYPLTAWRW